MINRLSPSFLVKLIAVSAALVVLSSCAAEKEVTRYSPPPAEPPPPVVVPEPAVPAPRMKTSLRCAEDTKKVFNRCGIDAFPFLRTAFYDIDDDGEEEMIVGGKEGTLRLFKNYGTAIRPEWRVVGDYFKGISVGAFSSPAVGDL